MRIKKITILIYFTFFFFSNVWGYQIIENAPIHESYMTMEMGALYVVAVPETPPPQINETIPQQKDSRTQWISGYWSWSSEKNKFLWVSGTWRRPPPGYFWIGGYWKRYEEGWVWIQGFWSNTQADALSYINLPPQERLEEDTSNPPKNNYFWIPGNWIYNNDHSRYEWYKGKWEELTHDWVLVPSHYYWRPGGYVYIPNYWDWVIEDRGTVYATIDFSDHEKSNVLYEPRQIVDSSQIIMNYFPYYPDYLLHYTHLYYFHLYRLSPFKEMIPTWWKWQEWWTLEHHHQWALWWWYIHPGYPAPYWLTEKDAEMISPPTEDILNLAKNILPPPIVTSKGVINQTELIHAINEIRGSKGVLMAPIIPFQKEKTIEIQNLVIEQNKKNGHHYLKPKGIKEMIFSKPFDKNAPPKPDIKQRNSKEAIFSGKEVSVPPQPVINQEDLNEALMMNHMENQHLENANFSGCLDIAMADYVQVPATRYPSQYSAPSNPNSDATYPDSPHSNLEQNIQEPANKGSKTVNPKTQSNPENQSHSTNETKTISAPAQHAEYIQVPPPSSPNLQYPGPYSQYGSPYSQYGSPYSRYPGPYSPQYGGPNLQYPGPYSQYGSPYSQYPGPMNPSLLYQPMEQPEEMQVQQVEEYNINTQTTQPITPSPPLQSNEYKVPSAFAENFLPKVDEQPYFIPGQTPQISTQVPYVNNERDHYKPPLPRAQKDEGFLMNHLQPQQNPGPSVNNSTGFRPMDRDYNPAFP